MNAFNNIIVAYKVENGFMRDKKILEYSSNRESLEYLIECSTRYDDYKNKGYKLAIYSIEQ